MKRIAFFIPFRGCTRRCIYCDQAAITGSREDDTLSPEAVSGVLSQQREAVELCFFGGSFGRLDRETLLSYLETIHHAPRGSVITFSSYPGDFDGERGKWLIQELSKHPIGTIELGIPSLDPAVLEACGRDDSTDNILKNIVTLRGAGFHIGVQMMIGLPKQSWASSLADIETVGSLIAGREEPWHLRIYPCLVLRSTALAAMYERGEFVPLSLEEAIRLSALLLIRAEEAGFKAIRVGLLNSNSLRESIIAGPFHPSFGELVLSEKLALKMASEAPKGPWAISAKTKSHLTGHGKRGLLRLAELTSLEVETVCKMTNYQ